MKRFSVAASAVLAGVIASFSGAVCAQAAIKPPQPNGPPKVDPKTIAKLQPDFSVAIAKVTFQCPKADASPLLNDAVVIVDAVLKNNGVKFDENASVIQSWSVDGVKRTLSGPMPAGTYLAQLNSPAGYVHRLGIPLKFFEGVGKGDIAKLAAPRTVPVKFELNAQATIVEQRTDNNVAETTATIPAHLCP